MITTADVALNEYAMPIKFGDKEVIELLYVSANIELSGIDTYLRVFFNRRTTKAEASPVTPETEQTLMGGMDTFWSCAHFQYMTTSGVYIRSKLEQVFFPTPLLLLRAPRVIVQGNTAQKLYIFFYYIKRAANKEELARLMVKAHS
jgi:hypothetical protein